MRYSIGLISWFRVVPPRKSCSSRFMLHGAWRFEPGWPIPVEVEGFMSLFDEKRGAPDRRARNDGPPPGSRERRSRKDRRQTRISEISFHEWTRYFLRYKKHIAEKTATGRVVKGTESETRNLPHDTVRQGGETIDTRRKPPTSS
jgi:hypothetical protein